MATTMSQSLSFLKNCTAPSQHQHVDAGTIPGQSGDLELMLKVEEISCLDDILSAVMKVPSRTTGQRCSGSPNYL